MKVRSVVVACGLIVGLASGANAAILITTTTAPVAGIWQSTMAFPPIEFPIIANRPEGSAYAFVIQNAYDAPVPMQIEHMLGQTGYWQVRGDARFQILTQWLQGAGFNDTTDRDAALFTNISLGNEPMPGVNIGDVVEFGNGIPNLLSRGNDVLTGSTVAPLIFDSGLYEVFMTDENGVRISGNAIAVPEPSGIILAGMAPLSLIIAFGLRFLCRGL